MLDSKKIALKNCVRMASLRYTAFKFSCISSHASLSLRYCSSVAASTKHYRNLSQKDQRLVDKLIEDAPGSDISMSNLLTGKGITDPKMTGVYYNVQKTMMTVLARQFPNIMDRMKFFGKYLKTTLSHAKVVTDTKTKLNASLSGAAIEHNLVHQSFQGMILTKTLIDMYGHERANEMLSKCQEEVSPIMNDPMIRYLESKVPHHLRYAVSNGVNKRIIDKSTEEDGIFDIEWIDDDIYSKEFGFNVKRCVFRDIGKEMGDTEEGGEKNLTYTWFCQFDDKMIPGLGEEADFRFERDGTLGKGCSHCDFRFKHEEKERPKDNKQDKYDNDNETLFG